MYLQFNFTQTEAGLKKGTFWNLAAREPFRIENTLRQLCWPYKDARACQKWGKNNKLCGDRQENGAVFRAKKCRFAPKKWKLTFLCGNSKNSK